MDSIIRGCVVYLFLLVVFRIAGKRSLGQITTFDLVLTLIVSEAVQQALLSDDGSMTNGFLVVITLVSVDVALSILKHRYPKLKYALDGRPVVIMRDGELLRAPLDRERVEADDILASARFHSGIGRLADIRHAVLEENGGISIIPTAPDRRL